MSEQRSVWQRFFGRRGSSSLNQRQQRVLRYIIERRSASRPKAESHRSCERSTSGQRSAAGEPGASVTGRGRS